VSESAQAVFRPKWEMTELVSSINTPLAVALLFAFAGAIFIGIYTIRRIRGETPRRKPEGSDLR
jgi:hypothetical protein